MYRSPKNFTRPDEFIPECWISSSDEFIHDNKSAINPLSTGSRNSIGRKYVFSRKFGFELVLIVVLLSLAYLEIRLLMSTLLQQYDLELASDSKDWFARNRNFVLWDKPPLNIKLVSAARPRS